jgi:hypothetical protein
MATSRTALDLITASLQSLGVYAAAETLSAEDADLALDTLQDLLAEWSDGGLMVPCTVTEAITLVVGQVSYTVGESGSPDKNTVRPEQVVNAYVRDSSSRDYDVTIIGEKKYQDLVVKTSITGRPDRIYVKYSAPNAVIYVFPEPSIADSLYIVSIKPFTEPTTLPEALLNTTEIPRNYFNALKWNLALELSLPFLRDPSPLLVKRANDTKKSILNLNAARIVEPVDLGLGSARGSSLADFFEG